MSTINSYKDCQEHLDNALDSESGISLELETKGMATRMMQRLNTCRKLFRERSKEIYPSTDPQWNISPWDHLVIKRDPENEVKVLITAQRITIVKVTPL